MAIRQYKEYRTSIKTRTDSLVDNAHIIAKEQLIPAIAKMSRNSVTVDRIEFYAYSRKRSGRRCSCFQVESTPGGDCRVCANTGIVGGYDKFGCFEEILDVSRPGLRLLGVRPAYELMRRPVAFAMDDGALVGLIEFDVAVRANTQHVDMFQLNVSLPDPSRSSIKGFLRREGSLDWAPLTEASFSSALYGKKFSIRIRFQRNSSDVSSPTLRDLRLRYRIIDQPRITADVPIRTESILLQDFGLYQQNQQITMFVPDTLRKVGNEDFFIMVEEGTRWRVIETTPNKPSNILTSHMLVCVNILPHHPAYEFPI